MTWQTIDTAPRDRMELRHCFGAQKHKIYGWLYGQLDYSPPSSAFPDGYYFTGNGLDPSHWIRVEPPL